MTLSNLTPSLEWNLIFHIIIGKQSLVYILLNVASTFKIQYKDLLNCSEFNTTFITDKSVFYVIAIQASGFLESNVEIRLQINKENYKLIVPLKLLSPEFVFVCNLYNYFWAAATQLPKGSHYDWKRGRGNYEFQNYSWFGVFICIWGT